jgi:hypothetical protein
MSPGSIWTDSDQTERITQVHLLVDRQKLKWCDVQVCKYD